MLIEQVNSSINKSPLAYFNYVLSLFIVEVVYRILRVHWRIYVYRLYFIKDIANNIYIGCIIIKCPPNFMGRILGSDRFLISITLFIIFLKLVPFLLWMISFIILFSYFTLSRFTCNFISLSYERSGIKLQRIWSYLRNFWQQFSLYVTIIIVHRTMVNFLPIVSLILFVYFGIYPSLTWYLLQGTKNSWNLNHSENFLKIFCKWWVIKILNINQRITFMKYDHGIWFFIKISILYLYILLDTVNTFTIEFDNIFVFDWF